jgi:purine-nucleoside phosphorylase
MTRHRGEGPSTISLPVHDQLQLAVTTIRARVRPRQPVLGLVLGSGLGGFADQLEDAVALEYGDIPHFPISNVVGHAGRLVVGQMHGVTCAAMQGRVHYYEGHELDRVTFPIRALILLGCRTLIITNAAGGVNPDLKPGDLVVLRDHLNLFPDNPLRGENDDRLGPRFPDMTQAYATALRVHAHMAAGEIGLGVREGVYAGSSGPSYETPAEIRMLRTLGADLAGMSTIPEVIVANHMGARVLGISCVTNMAAGITGERLTHAEVTETAARVRESFIALVSRVIARLGASKEVG